MKFHLTLLFSFLGVIAVAQNYQTVRSTDVKYMMADHLSSDYDHILGIACDTAEFINGDSVFYFIKTLRYNPNDTTTNCPLHLGGSWLGKKVIIEPDGTNIYFNDYLDSIFIETNDTLGQESFMYKYPSGDSVFATVVNVSLESFLGYTDSVKTFLISSNYQYFNFDPLEFKISQNHGFVSMVPLYSFPSKYSENHYDITDSYEFVGQDNPTIGITKPTHFDIHNLEVGDFIAYKKTYNAYSGNYPTITTYYNKTVISKTVNGNSISYEMDYEEEVFIPAFQGNSASTTITYDTLAENYFASMEYVNDYMPGESWLTDQWSWPSFQDYTFDLYYSSTCGYKSITETRAYLDTTYSDCLESWHVPTYTNYEFSGANDYYYTCWDVQSGGSGGCNEGSYLIYKSNSGLECGVPFYVGIEESEAAEIIIYPNPSNGIIHINSSEEWVSYRVISVTGEIVQSGSKISLIDISNQNPGVYILELQLDDQFVRKRIIKN